MVAMQAITPSGAVSVQSLGDLFDIIFGRTSKYNVGAIAKEVNNLRVEVGEARGGFDELKLRLANIDVHGLTALSKVDTLVSTIQQNYGNTITKFASDARAVIDGRIAQFKNLTGAIYATAATMFFDGFKYVTDSNVWNRVFGGRRFSYKYVDAYGNIKDWDGTIHQALLGNGGPGLPDIPLVTPGGWSKPSIFFENFFSFMVRSLPQAMYRYTQGWIRFGLSELKQEIINITQLSQSQFNQAMDYMKRFAQNYPEYIKNAIDTLVGTQIDKLLLKLDSTQNLLVNKLNNVTVGVFGINITDFDPANPDRSIAKWVNSFVTRMKNYMTTWIGCTIDTPADFTACISKKVNDVIREVQVQIEKFAGGIKTTMSKINTSAKKTYNDTLFLLQRCVKIISWLFSQPLEYKFDLYMKGSKTTPEKIIKAVLQGTAGPISWQARNMYFATYGFTIDAAAQKWFGHHYTPDDLREHNAGEYWGVQMRAHTAETTKGVNELGGTVLQMARVLINGLGSIVQILSAGFGTFLTPSGGIPLLPTKYFTIPSGQQDILNLQLPTT